MKKLITLMLVGLLCITAAACSGTQKTATTDSATTSDSAATSDSAQTPEPEDLVVSEKYYNVYAYDENDPDKKAQDTVTAYEYEFDSGGHPTKTTVKRDGKVEMTKETEYNAAGNIVKQTVFDADGIKTSVTSYEYDGNNKTKLVAYNADGKVSSELTYSYDEKGYLIEEHYRADDYSYTIKYENDEDGKALTSTQSDENGSDMMKTTYKYDSNGRLICESRSYGFGAAASGLSESEYEYDDRGNIVKEVCHDGNGGILYSYDRVYKTVRELSGK